MSKYEFSVYTADIGKKTNVIDEIKKCYFILFEYSVDVANSDALFIDEEISKFFEIPLENYRKILKQFGAQTIVYNNISDSELFFLSESQANKCKDYLEEYFIPMLKLKEGV